MPDRKMFFNIPIEGVGNVIVKATGLGESREEAEFEALEHATEFAKKVPGALFNKTTFDDLEETIEEGRKFGLNPDEF